MQKKVLIFVVLFAICICQNGVDPQYNHDKFMKQFNKVYTKEEKVQHQKIFNINYAWFLNIIKDIPDQEFWPVINSQFDWNQSQIDGQLNYHPQQLKIPLSSPSTLTLSSLFLSPPSFDWRTYDRVTDVRNQRSCGSCWAFAATAQYESLLAIATNGTKYNLSEQYLLQCDTNSFGCNGGYTVTSLMLANSTGIPLQEQYPYQNKDNFYNKSQICTEKNTTRLQYKVQYILHTSIATNEQIQQNLITFGPLSVGVSAGINEFRFPSSMGSISCPDAGINHVVLLYGYNQTHWFIKNSWGTGWGDKGHAYILKTKNCKIDKWVDIMQVNFPTPMPAPIPPTPQGTVNYMIQLIDFFEDGWNNNILAIRQNGVTVATFGRAFTSGGAYGPENALLTSNVLAQVVIHQLGTWTQQIEFYIKAPNGSIVFTRVSGNKFTSASQIFFQFCPTSGCTINTRVTYYLTTSDSRGNGWEGTVLSFRQNGTQQTFRLLSGSTGPSTPYNFTKGLNVSIVVSVLGKNTQQIGFILRNSAGAIVFQRRSGRSFAANTLLGTFCVDCVNLSPVAYVPDLSRPQSSQSSNSDTSNTNQFKIATFVLAPLLLLMTIISIIAIIKASKLAKQLSKMDTAVPTDIASTKQIIIE